MSRKTGSPPAKEKMAMKAKITVTNSSRLEDDDVEMVDAEYKHEHSDMNGPMDEQADEGERAGGNNEDGPERHAGGGDDDELDGGGGDGDDCEGEGEISPGPIPGGMDEATALAIFEDYCRFGSYMMPLSSRLKTMLNNIKMTADPTTRLVTLQELSELLSISTGDTLAGSSQVEQFARELVRILGGRGVEDEDDGDDGDEDSP